ncbi:MAG: hypothetical protein V2A64_06775 [Candidatus Omnitrophota bacterium]
MDKKDIYEHLAKIYLDASSSKIKKNKRYFIPKNVLFLSFSLAIIFAGTVFFNFQKNKPLDSEIALVLQSDRIKINFNFDPAKKEVYLVNLNKLNLNKYKTLAFSIKKGSYKDSISLRVEFTNIFNEKSAAYITNIPHKWQEYKIDFSEFKNITDWSEMLNICFIIEQWNAKENHDIVYIDNIRFLRNL